MGRKLRDGLIAAAAGSGMAAVSYAVLTRPFESVSTFYLGKSLPEGGGTNAVNVIIVDFRGFDTLGEITVLAIAGLAISAMLAGIAGRARPGLPARGSLIMQTATRLLLPLMVMVSVYLFLRGHNLPGGGFIAGLVFACALLIQYVASGVGWVETRIPPRWHAWAGLGLLLAGATGAGSLVAGYPFLTSSFAHPVLPVVGEVPIASAMFFDLGVFMTVVGATMLALTMLGRLGATDGGGEQWSS